MAHSTTTAKLRRGFTLVELLVCLLIIGILVAIFLPATRSASGAARRMQCTNNLKQLSLALLNYESDYGKFPPAYTIDADGKRLHSWRTLLLPYLEQKHLYDQIDLSKPWDDPANEAARKARPDCYVCPELKVEQQTTYLAINHVGGCFNGSESVRLRDLQLETSSTPMLCDVPLEFAQHWMEPVDIDLTPLSTFDEKKVKLQHHGVLHFAMANGSVTAVALKGIPELTSGPRVERDGANLTSSFTNTYAK